MILLESFDTENVVSSMCLIRGVRPIDSIERKREKGKKASHRCRRCGVVPWSLNFDSLPPEVLLYRNRTPVYCRKLSSEASYLPTASANWLHRAMRRDACRVAARANGVMCRVRGSHPDGKRALLLAERREGTPGTRVQRERGGGTGERGRVLGVAYARGR